VKIKIERPDAEAAREIFSKYLTPTLPLHPEDLANSIMIRRAVCKP
jgi:proteasome-associated ATPase